MGGKGETTRSTDRREDRSFKRHWARDGGENGPPEDGGDEGNSIYGRSRVFRNKYSGYGRTYTRAVRNGRVRVYARRSVGAFAFKRHRMENPTDRRGGRAGAVKPLSKFSTTGGREKIRFSYGRSNAIFFEPEKPLTA